MRRLVHPGPAIPERTRSVPCRAKPLTLRLPAGPSVLAAAHEALRAEGCEGGYVRIGPARMAPLRYVIPAGAPGDGHAAWYSETFAFDAPCEVEEAVMFVGRRDGEPFVHCHGIWRTPEGRRMGHLLPAESVLHEAVDARGWGVSGAMLEVHDDPETRFRLFSPQPTEEATDGRPALLATVRPNEEIGSAIEGILRHHGIARAEICGIGSLVGAEFEDRPPVESYATEVLVRNGRVTPEGCALDVAIVGMDGKISEGRLARRRNPVCVTFELLILGQG
ncbi:DUF296 domain-containing protein [Lutibaculum baratangense]|uniref:Uncharacterized protein n=1 Tax=Lutibaculum baratangense AMV1 TaxID=631454 RepID=V4TBU2_9HYPH|nr:DUF296 domain-containing protein [Lutibaculum baratangense]ESR23843.1 uncharacterized protein N177_2788 [Lutibaculum baratangense AMV1]